MKRRLPLFRTAKSSERAEALFEQASEAAKARRAHLEKLVELYGK